MWLAVNKNKEEVIFDHWIKPRKDFKKGIWYSDWEVYGIVFNRCMKVPKGTIKKLTGRTTD